jgi:hypothetical protein
MYSPFGATFLAAGRDMLSTGISLEDVESILGFLFEHSGCLSRGVAAMKKRKVHARSSASSDQSARVHVSH